MSVKYSTFYVSLKVENVKCGYINDYKWFEITERIMNVVETPRR